MSENSQNPHADAEQSSRESDSAADAPAAAPTAPKRSRLLRRALLLIGPLLVLVVGAWVYYTGGRYVETENAYVKADMAVISAEVAGPVVRVEVDENQSVAAGDVLFAIDDRPYRVALARAEAQLQAVSSMIESVGASYRQRLEELALARTDYEFAERELQREQRLAADDLGSEAAVDRAQHDFDSAEQRIHIVERGLEQLRAQLGGAPDGDVTDQPAYHAAQAARDAAALDLERTVVRAAFTGVASKVPVVGEHVAPGVAVMSLVADSDLWIEANYKETDLTHVCVGQPVEIRVDTYPDRVWSGEVQSISQATGATFSVIPAQNATGNWVKVIQRIPVRLAVHGTDQGPPLRTGMSATVEIDTGHQRALPGFLAPFAADAVANNRGASADCNAT